LRISESKKTRKPGLPWVRNVEDIGEILPPGFGFLLKEVLKNFKKPNCNLFKTNK
jgi:hypothetical protein